MTDNDAVTACFVVYFMIMIAAMAIAAYVRMYEKSKIIEIVHKRFEK